jgi:DNA-binding transcriptional MocR family regulator
VCKWGCCVAARILLIEMLARFRPGENGKLEWSVRRAADILRISKSTAAAALIELETTGWIEVTRAGRFSQKSAASHCALATFANDVTGAPATKAYEYWRPDGPRPLAARCRVSRQERSVRPEVQYSQSTDQILSAVKDAEAK